MCKSEMSYYLLLSVIIIGFLVLLQLNGEWEKWLEHMLLLFFLVASDFPIVHA